MVNLEFQRSIESAPQKLDAIVVLGKNIGVDWTAQDIQNQRFHLSPHSRINVDTAGLLYKAGITQHIIFSTGKTAGKDVPSEAALMKYHLQRIFPTIPDSAIELEQDSWDTNTNAKAVKRIIKQKNYKNVGLLTTEFHAERAEYLFARAGINLEELFYSEEQLGEKFPRYAEKYVESALVKREVVKEDKALSLQQKPLVPEMISLITWLTRNRTLSGLSLLKP